jgi:hypothetical protein
MISGKTLLPILMGAALGAAGWMNREGGDSASGLERQLEIAEEQLVLLERENASLRAMANGGSKIEVPAEMIAKVEKDYGVKFLGSPVFHRTSSEELALRIEAALESKFGPQGIEDRQEAYRWIGWLGEEDVLLEQLVAVRSVGANAWFDESTSEVWLTERFDLKNITDQATMMRLLVRILLSQHFPVPDEYPGDDAARVREALHGGAASGAETRYYATSALGMGFLPKNDSSATTRLMLSLSDFVKGLSFFSATAGKQFADTLYARGPEHLMQVMRNPPAHTLGLVSLHKAENSGNEAFAEISDEIYLEESAGYLGLLLWFAQFGDVEKAEQLAQAWRGDRYVLFADGEASSALVWELNFQHVDAASAFLEIANQVCAKPQDARYLGVRRLSATRVRFYNAATPLTAERLATED